MNQNTQIALHEDRAAPADLTAVNKLIFVKRYREAYDLIESLVAENPDDIVAQFRRVELASKLDALATLKNDCLHQVNRANPDQSFIPELLLGLIKLQNQSKDYDGIRGHFAELISKWGEQAAFYFAIGICLQNEGELSHAVESFQKALTLDPEFYPPYYNLSQIYYAQDMTMKGDQCFHHYEQHAPYNLYGNFEIHRSLCYELMDMDRPEDALAAIESLGEWWLENKGECPEEVKAYELLLASKVLDVLADPEEAGFRRNQALVICHGMLGEAKAYDGKVLYFVAKALEEFDQHDLAVRFYQAILAVQPLPVDMLDRIAKSYVSVSDFDTFARIIEATYSQHPDHQKVRFYRLLVGLKRHGTDVSAYLSLKEKAEDQLLNKSQAVETFQILYNLLARYDGDPDVHGYLAAIYADIPHVDKASQCYRDYLARDPHSQQARHRALAFYLGTGDLPQAREFVVGLKAEEQQLAAKIEAAFKAGPNPVHLADDSHAQLIHDTRDQLSATRGLLAEYHLLAGEWQSAIDAVTKVLAVDPWNLKHLCTKAKALTQLYAQKEPDLVDLLVGEDLSAFESGGWDWQAFDRHSQEWQERHRHGLVYLREKIRFLFFDPCAYSYHRVAAAARRFDQQAGLGDFVKLLNTNYHRPLLYGVLGGFTKGLGMLEASSQWYELLLAEEPDDPALRADGFLQLADTYIWQNSNINKAIEYLKLAMEFGRSSQEQISVKMAHAYLRKGDSQRAQQLLIALDGYRSLEAEYVRGLIAYRNGDVVKAKAAWKPLLTHRSESWLAHYIKGEIRRYYFQHEEYWQKN